MTRCLGVGASEALRCLAEAFGSKAVAAAAAAVVVAVETDNWKEEKWVKDSVGRFGVSQAQVMDSLGQFCGSQAAVAAAAVASVVAEETDKWM